MTRAFMFVAVLAVLIAGGYVTYQRIEERGLKAFVQSLGIRQSGRAAAEEELLAAAVTLDRERTWRGSFAGADLRKHANVVVAYASDTEYCIQVTKSDSTHHLAGPGGKPQDGPCFAA